VVADFAASGLSDGSCTTINRVLAEAPGSPILFVLPFDLMMILTHACDVVFGRTLVDTAEAKGDELKQLEPFFTTALAVATPPTSMPVRPVVAAPAKVRSPKVEGKSPRATPTSGDDTTAEEPKSGAKKAGKRKDKDPFDTEDKIKPPTEVKKQKKEVKANDEGDDNGEKKDTPAEEEEQPVVEEKVEEKYVALRETLWFGIQLELSRLYVKAKLWSKAASLVKQLYDSDFTSTEQKIALKAVELTMHIDKADAKAADVTLGWNMRVFIATS
jgi:cell pole-organizing protein PopZ